MKGFFTLQANQRGAWKNVLTFNQHDEQAVLTAAIALARASGEFSWRITDGDWRVRWAMTGAYQWQRDPFKRVGA